MEWIKVKIEYYSENMKKSKEKLINLFEEIGIKEIEVLDYFSNNSLDYNVKFPNEYNVWTVIGYIINNRFSRKKLNIIFEKLTDMSEDENDFIYEIYTSECNDNDWKDQWKKYFHTVEISENIVIKPSWDDYDNVDNKLVIELDPGSAFGTGTHETTSLCVDFLKKYCANSDNLLDIGCGSGILMLIGKKLGIENVVGIDIDPLVEDVVIENFNKNSILNGYEIIIGNLVDKIDKKYDLVVSNILVDVLENLLENIEKVLNTRSKIIFSGILLEKEEQFIDKVLKYKMNKIDRKEKNNWVSLVFEYRGSDI